MTACGGSKGSGNNSNNNSTKKQASSSKNDVNAVAYDQVPSGGTLRWAIDSFPPNFNINEVDGNDINISNIMQATLPQIWHFDAGGNPILNTDVVDKAEQTSTSPQTIHYHVNPKAVWSDGSQITYKDFVGLWNALNGTNKAFQPASTNGYQDIASVTKGDTDQDAVVTFKTAYPDWKSLFSPLMPASLNASPTAFNKSWVSSPNVSAGPFKIDSIDKTAKTITLVHNDKWWGRPAKL